MEVSRCPPDCPSWDHLVDLLVYSSSANAGTGYFDISELRRSRAFWAVTNHDGDAGAGLSGWVQTRDRLADLGARFVRTDLRWSWFEEAGDENWSTTKINYWKDVVRAAKARGIGLVAILNGPKPSWVTDANKYSQFQGFCKKMAQEFGADVYYYQILNEHNVNQEIAGDLPTFASNCYNGLLLGEGVSATNHKSVFKTIVNIYANIFNWDPDLRAGLTLPASPSTLQLSITIRLLILARRATIGAHSTLCPKSLDKGKEGAIMETGYSSTPAGQTMEQNQEAWVNCALPIIRSKVSLHNGNNAWVPMLIAGFYELVDQATGGWTLDNFGLLRTNLSEKPAYDDFRSQVANFAG